MSRYWMTGVLAGALVAGMSATGFAFIDPADEANAPLYAMGRSQQEQEQPGAEQSEPGFEESDPGAVGTEPGLGEEPAGGGGTTGGEEIETDGGAVEPAEPMEPAPDTGAEPAPAEGTGAY